ncbi:MAG TPA: nucleotidyltransferase domain-containing protein [Dehalococcoidia bacterium]|nr:nucleotidyltransferase domain-containing protein [Dehalococcoidia bacterium]
MTAIRDRVLEQKEALAALGRHFGVRRLDLFGSATTGAHESDRSDLDFLVDFEEESPDGYADRYFGLLEELERLFACPVDLVIASAIRNPYFRESVEQTRVLVYAS